MPSVSPEPHLTSGAARTAVRAAPAAARKGMLRSLLIVIFVLTAALIGSVLLSIVSGEAEVAQVVTLPRATTVLAVHLLHRPAPQTDDYAVLDRIVWEQRGPRALGGALVGMLLALAGVAFQSLLRNPLADPYMIGVSAGSALGSVTVTLALGALVESGATLGAMLPTGGAFVAGLITMAIVYAMSHRRGRLSTQTFLLAGIIVGTILWSLLQLLLALVVRSRDPGRASAILAQQLGSLQFLGWREFSMLFCFGLAGSLALASSWRELNVMTLGEESAVHLGVNVEALKRRIIVAGSLITAAAVSVSGIIAFVGMVMPHIARRLVGPDHRRLLPTAMLLGGLVVVVSDCVSRVFLNGIEIGVITSLVGGPVFCYLLRRQMRASG